MSHSPLALLARYYLDCLSIDDVGISEPIEKSNYIVFSTLPLMGKDSDDALSNLDYGHLIKLRKDKQNATVYLGYPIRLHAHKAQRKHNGLRIEPLFLIPVEIGENGKQIAISKNDSPLFNFAAWRDFAVGNKETVASEIANLSNILGLDKPIGEKPDWTALFEPFAKWTETWNWKESFAPSDIKTGNITKLDQEGLYNRAVLIIGDQSIYTKGLKTELTKLAEQTELPQNSVLKGILTNNLRASPSNANHHILEIIPLNAEQRSCVEKALTQPVTVITGPPGNGKSQVVSAILVNAALQGMTVLLASKNNQAVDVVEERTNKLSTRPLIIRVKGDQRNELSEFLTQILTFPNDEDDEKAYEKHLATIKNIRAQIEKHERQLQDIIEQRNKVDQIDRTTGSLRKAVSTKDFQAFRNKNNAHALQKKLFKASRTVANAIREEQGFLTRLIWPLIQSRRFSQADKACRDLHGVGKSLGITSTTSNDLMGWRKYATECEKHLRMAIAAANYFAELEKLKNFPPLEELYGQIAELFNQLAQVSDALWQCWMRLYPKRLSAEDRNALSDYTTSLRMAENQNTKKENSFWKKYYNLRSQVTHALPCWAVTTLSAQHLPFDAGFFDLVVLDEASQCDLASALPLLYRAKRVVIIGDSKQLRHISSISRTDDMHLLEKHGLADKFLRWSYSSNSLFDLAQASVAQNEHIIMLRNHYRSHEDIIGFSNQYFYGNQLRVATKYENLNTPTGIKSAVEWVDVKGDVIRPSDGGALNQQEVNQAVATIRALIISGTYAGSIGVVSPFRAQANAIMRAIYNDEQVSTAIAKNKILIDTVHKFQGGERDVMIFSPVVSDGISQGALGFLKNDPTLFNVAITRARAALIVIGNWDKVAKCGVPYMEAFANYTKKLADKRITESANPYALGDEYPPVANPERVSEWEKVFYKALRAKGIRPMPQYKVERYDLDFAIIIGNAKLNIEIDGEAYHKDWNGDLLHSDKIRTHRLLELGWDVKRFWVYQVRDELDLCINEVSKWVNAHKH